MIGVVVPAHNEEACLGDCLRALAAAARHPDLGGEAVRIVVVLDACQDGSRGIVLRHAAAHNCARISGRTGGFAALACHADVALVAALERSGAHFAWSAAPRVVTSGRTDARARGGFGDTLLGLAETSLGA